MKLYNDSRIVGDQMSSKKSSGQRGRSGTKTRYKQGTINGVSTGSNFRAYERKKKQQDEYKSLVKMLCGAVCVLIAVFIINAIVQANFTFNGIYYEEPEENEVIEIVSSTNENEPAERVNLNLQGDLVVNLKVGQKYKEPGYSATSDLKGDITGYVKVTGNVDTSKVGTYKLTYTLDYRGISPKLTRLVNVTEKGDTSSNKPNNSETNKPSNSPSVEPSSSPQPSNNPSPSVSPSPSPTPTSTPETGNITLSLNGEATVYIVEGGTFKDPGAKAVDNKGKDVSSQIKKSGTVNTNVAGTYKITYSITNYNGQVLSVVRNVVVQQMGIKITTNPTDYTNKSVTITIVASVDQFSSMVLPSGERVTEQIYNYKVTKNGTYEFIVYNKNGDSRKATMVVDNIDKEKPRGTCVIKHEGNGSIVTVNAKDNTGIKSYTYSGTTYTTNVIKFDRRIQSGLQINIGFYDLAGNFSTCNCLAP